MSAPTVREVSTYPTEVSQLVAADALIETHQTTVLRTAHSLMRHRVETAVDITRLCSMQHRLYIICICAFGILTGATIERADT